MNDANLLIIYMISNTMKTGVPHLHMKIVLSKFSLDGLISILVSVGALDSCSANLLALNLSF